MPEAELSVIIATLNRPELLRKAIAAIDAQRFEGVIETILVFDQSEPDSTLERVGGDRPVQVVRNERTPGLPGARNTGARVASAPVLAFCDDDDEWLPDKTAHQLAVLHARPEVDVVAAGMLVDFGGRAVDRLPPAEVRVEDLVRDRITALHSSNVMLRREAFFERIGDVDEDIPGGYAEDYDFLLRAARSKPIVGVQEPLVLVRWGQGSFFAEKWDMIDRALAYLVDKHPEFQDHPEGLARILGQRAFASAALGRRSESVALARRTLRANWREPRGYLALLANVGLSPAFVLRILNRFGRGI